MLSMYPWQWIYRSLSNMLMHVCSVPKNCKSNASPRQSPSLFPSFSTQDAHPEHESGSTTGSPQPHGHFVLEVSIPRMMPESAQPTRIDLVATAATIRAPSESAGGAGSKTLKNVAGRSHVFFNVLRDVFLGFCIARRHSKKNPKKTLTTFFSN